MRLSALELQLGFVRRLVHRKVQVRRLRLESCELKRVPLPVKEFDLVFILQVRLQPIRNGVQEAFVVGTKAVVRGNTGTNI